MKSINELCENAVNIIEKAAALATKPEMNTALFSAHAIALVAIAQALGRLCDLYDEAIRQPPAEVTRS